MLFKGLLFLVHVVFIKSEKISTNGFGDFTFVKVF